jgi:DNA phosphorothioation-associated putative methyltransferase
MNSHKTAISRTKISKPMHLFEHYGLLIGRTLDYGCGKGKDVEILNIEGYDPYYFPDKPIGKFDTVVMNYVINTISTHRGRMDAIRSAWSYVDVGGMLIVTSRTSSEIYRNAKRSDWIEPDEGGGYITSKKTFQIGFENSDLESFLSSLIDGLVARSPVITNSFSHAIAVKLRI